MDLVHLTKIFFVFDKFFLHTIPLPPSLPPSLPPCSVEDIVSAASTEYRLPSKFVVLFSTKNRFYIAGHNTLTPQQFRELLDDAGGTEGHALLYLLPVTQLSPDKVMSDFSCIAPLSKS